MIGFHDFRALAIVVAGGPPLSQLMTSSFLPAICQPLSSQKSSQPLYMSLPAWAMAPDSGARKPILTGPWANASSARPSEDAATSETIAISVCMTPEYSLFRRRRFPVTPAGPCGIQGAAHETQRRANLDHPHGEPAAPR